MRKARNGEIEALRLLFCVTVMLSHSHYLIGKPYPFLGGSLSVEFFFIVSGYLMAQTIEKKEQSDHIGSDTISFIRKKISVVLPNVVLAWIWGFVFLSICGSFTLADMGSTLKGTVWELLFLDMYGFSSGSVNGVTWYISSMLMSMMILYPLIRKKKDLAIHIVLPMAVLFILGWLFQNGTLRTPQKWFGIVFKGNLRAFAEISLGVLAFYLTQKLKQLKLSAVSKWLLTIMKFSVLFLYLGYMWAKESSKWDYAFVGLLTVWIAVIFSGQTVDAGCYQARIFSLMGKFSLPLYLSHMYYAKHLGEILPESMSSRQKLLIYIVCAVCTAVVNMILGDMVRKNSKRICAGLKNILLEKEPATEEVHSAER